MDRRIDQGADSKVGSDAPGGLGAEREVAFKPKLWSTIHWDIDFKFRSIHWFRPFVPSFVSQFEGVLRHGLKELKRQMENGQGSH